MSAVAVAPVCRFCHRPIAAIPLGQWCIRRIAPLRCEPAASVMAS